MNRKKVYRHEICVTRRDNRECTVEVKKSRKKESQTCNSSTVLKFIYVWL